MNDMGFHDAPLPLDQPIDLRRYVYLLFDTKWIIILGSLLCAYAAALYANSLPNIYESVALVDIVDPGDAGGIDPDNRVAPGSIGLLESGFVLNTSKENYTKTVYSRLNSRKFIRHFMDKHNIYALLYPQDWNEVEKVWRDGFELDRGKAFVRFEQEIISIFQNEESEIVAIAVRNTDPVLAAKLANLYAAEFNDYMRQITLDGVAAKIEFLEQNLSKSLYVEIEKMLYRLMEAQTAAATLANGQEEYALEVVDPATRSYDRFSPARKRIVLLALFLSAFLITGTIIALDILKNAKKKLDVYATERGRVPVIERPWSLRGILLRLLAVIVRPFKQIALKEK